MLRHQMLNANPVLVSLVQRLLDEDNRFDRTERRSTVRESFARPVIVRIGDAANELSAFSRNISPDGIGLVSTMEFPADTTAKLEILSTAGVSPTILSELKWCKPLGKGWFLSGWKFLTAVRG